MDGATREGHLREFGELALLYTQFAQVRGKPHLGHPLGNLLGSGGGHRLGALPGALPNARTPIASAATARCGAINSGLKRITYGSMTLLASPCATPVAPPMTWQMP